MAEEKALVPIEKFKEVLKKRAGEYWTARANYLTSVEQDVYFQRAIMYIASSEYVLKCTESKKGQAGLLKCISQALQLGLVFGGYVPQVHIMAFREKGSEVYLPAIVPTFEGIKMALLTDPPVIRNIDVKCIYSNHDILFSQNDVLKDEFDPIKHKCEQGEFLGCYSVITELDGTKRLFIMSRKEIENVRDNTLVYKIGKKSNFWENYFEDMAIKTCGKKSVKKYLAFKESLAKICGVDDEQIETITLTPEQAAEYQGKDAATRAMDRLNVQPERTADPEPVKQEEIDPDDDRDQGEFKFI